MSVSVTQPCITGQICLSPWSAQRTQLTVISCCCPLHKEVIGSIFTYEIHAKHEDYLRAKMFLMATNFNSYENIVSLGISIYVQLQ